MTNPVPETIFFAGSRGAIDMMRGAGMSDMHIALTLIEVRAAAISEERLRVERLASKFPPVVGIRAGDIIEMVRAD